MKDILEPERVYVVDEVAVKPGMIEAYRDAYMRRYAPGARSRGMTLEQVRITPSVILKDAPNTIRFVWSVAGIGAWWQMRFVSGREPEVAQWWKDAEAMTVSRRRTMEVDLPLGASAPGESTNV